MISEGNSIRTRLVLIKFQWFYDEECWQKKTGVVKSAIEIPGEILLIAVERTVEQINFCNFNKFYGIFSGIIIIFSFFF